MASNTISEGDLVQLKSGSETMTVSELVGSDGRAVCHYFDYSKNQMVEVRIGLAALRRVEK